MTWMYNMQQIAKTVLKTNYRTEMKDWKSETRTIPHVIIYYVLYNFR